MSIEVRLSALRNNLELLRSKTSAEVAVVIKADAYGLGIERVKPAFKDVKTFFVAKEQEGVSLRRAMGGSPDIFVLNGFCNQELFHKYNLIPVLNTQQQMIMWDGDFIACHVDTGMNRLGLASEHLPKGVDLLLSHMAVADNPNHPMNKEQTEKFQKTVKSVEPKRASLLNSSTLFHENINHFDMVRTGMALYGLNPTSGEENNPMQPVVTVTAPVLQVRQVERGEGIGYGASYVTDNPRTIATIGMGYGDGLMRSLSNCGKVEIKGVLCPYVGRVSMDSFTADITGLDVKENDAVTVLGDLYDAEAMAKDAGTIGYEILTNLRLMRA